MLCDLRNALAPLSRNLAQPFGLGGMPAFQPRETIAGDFLHPVRAKIQVGTPQHYADQHEHRGVNPERQDQKNGHACGYRKDPVPRRLRNAFITVPAVLYLGLDDQCHARVWLG